MPDYDVKIMVDGPDGTWAGLTGVRAGDLPEVLRVLFELGGVPADVVADAADDGDRAAAAALEAKARPMLGVARG